VALRDPRERPHFEGFKLWVEAVCLNQVDYEERETQVRKMQNIYCNAWTVIVWLGEEENEREKAIDLIKTLSAAGREDCGEALERKLTEEPSYLGTGCWLALHELMQRPYWTRLQVIQEIVLGSSRVLIRCGGSCVEWTSLCTGIEVLFSHLWTLKDRLLKRDVALCNRSMDTRRRTPSLYLVYKDLIVLSRHEEQGGDHLSFRQLLDVANATISRDVRQSLWISRHGGPCNCQVAYP
jgi:hypothetical protein